MIYERGLLKKTRDKGFRHIFLSAAGDITCSSFLTQCSSHFCLVPVMMVWTADGGPRCDAGASAGSREAVAATHPRRLPAANRRPDVPQVSAQCVASRPAQGGLELLGNRFLRCPLVVSNIFGLCALDCANCRNAYLRAA
jgi:hypothetical protein